jgi:hypothetical protein
VRDFVRFLCVRTQQPPAVRLGHEPLRAGQGCAHAHASCTAPRRAAQKRCCIRSGKLCWHRHNFTDGSYSAPPAYERLLYTSDWVRYKFNRI